MLGSQFFQQHADAPGDLFNAKFRYMVLNAYKKKFENLSEAKLYLSLQGADLETTVSILIMMEKWDTLGGRTIKEALFTPSGCGDVTNAFCMLMTQNTMATARYPNNRKSLAELSQEFEGVMPKIIRIDILSHSYVMLCTEKSENNIFGFIYQSNIAEGMNDHCFSLAAWLMDKGSRKTNLSEHVEKLEELLAPETSDDRKKIVYNELFMAEPLVEVITPADMDLLIAAYKKPTKAYYQAKNVDISYMIAMLEARKAANDASLDKHLTLDEYIDAVKEKLNDAEQDRNNDDARYIS